jgi:hypothetical protein
MRLSLLQSLQGVFQQALGVGRVVDAKAAILNGDEDVVPEGGRLRPLVVLFNALLAISCSC